VALPVPPSRIQGSASVRVSAVIVCLAAFARALAMAPAAAASCLGPGQPRCLPSYLWSAKEATGVLGLSRGRPSPPTPFRVPSSSHPANDTPSIALPRWVFRLPGACLPILSWVATRCPSCLFLLAYSLPAPHATVPSPCVPCSLPPPASLLVGPAHPCCFLSRRCTVTGRRGPLSVTCGTATILAPVAEPLLSSDLVLVEEPVPSAERMPLP